MFFISSLFLALLLSTILFFHKQRKQTNLPPSPFKLPILGNLHQLGSSPHRALRVLSQEHGPLMLLHMGLTPTLVVSSRDAAEEIMKTHDLIFSSRPSSFMAHKLLYGSKDLALAPYGEYWRQAKKMFIVELLNQKRVDSFRTVKEEEIMNMMEKISSSSSQLGLVNLSELLVRLNNDIICRVAFGKKYSQREGEDGGSGNENSRIKKLIEELSELMGSFYVGDFIPSLAWIGRLSGLVERAEKTSRKWDDLLEGIIMDHEDGKRETVDGTVKDFLDVLLNVKEDTSFGVPLAKDHVKALVLIQNISGLCSALRFHLQPSPLSLGDRRVASFRLKLQGRSNLCVLIKPSLSCNWKWQTWSGTKALLLNRCLIDSSAGNPTNIPPLPHISSVLALDTFEQFWRDAFPRKNALYVTSS